MSRILFACLLLLAVSNQSVAQLDTNYFNYYGDEVAPNHSFAERVMPDGAGGFYVFGRRVDEFSAITLPFIQHLIPNQPANTSLTLPDSGSVVIIQDAEVGNGSLYLFGMLQRDVEDYYMLLSKVAYDLSEVNQIAILDPDPDLIDTPLSMVEVGGNIVTLHFVYDDRSETETFGENYYLRAYDTTDLSLVAKLDDALPNGAFAPSLTNELIEIPGERRIATAVITNSPSIIFDVLLIREFDATTLDIVAEYRIAGNRSETFSVDFVYVPSRDAYAFTNKSGELLLLDRGQSNSPPVLERVPPPAGFTSASFRSSIEMVDSSVYVYGQGAVYAYTFGGAVDSASLIRDASVDPPYAFPVSASSDNQSIAFLNQSFNTVGNPINLFFYSAKDGTFVDTVRVCDTLRGNSVIGIYEIYPLADGPGGDTLIGLGGTYRKNNRLAGGSLMIDALSGEEWESRIYSSDISFWRDTTSGPSLNKIFATDNGYLTSVTEHGATSRITFFRLDDSLRILQPDSVGFATIQPRTGPVFSSNQDGEATTYGLIGSNIFSPGFDEYIPFVFGVDSNLNVRFDLNIDTALYVPFSPIMLSVDSNDRFYSLGLSQNESFESGDLFHLAYHDVDGSIIDFTTIASTNDEIVDQLSGLELNEAENELLLSTRLLRRGGSDIGIYRLSTHDGAIRQATVLSAQDLGYESIDIRNAVYGPVDGTIVAAGSATLASGREIAVAVGIDTSGTVLSKSELGEFPPGRAVIAGLTRIGASIFLAGSHTSFSGEYLQPFLISITAGELVNADPNHPVLSPLLSTAPNPTSGLTQLGWEQPRGGEFILRVFDGAGRILFADRGYRNAGEARYELNTAGWPTGVYFLRMDTPRGYLTERLIKR